MNKHTMVSINYRTFTDQVEDAMIIAKTNAISVRRNAAGYYDPESRAAAYEARVEALFDAWQMATISNYEEIDRARLADLL